MAKKKKEIRDMSKDQLIDHIEVLKKELFNLKIEIMSGQNNNTSNISKIKKDIARAKTFINIQSKEMAYYYKIFRNYFGDIGGDKQFELFGDYPVMQQNIVKRTSKSGS